MFTKHEALQTINEIYKRHNSKLNKKYLKILQLNQQDMSNVIDMEAETMKKNKWWGESATYFQTNVPLDLQNLEVHVPDLTVEQYNILEGEDLSLQNEPEIYEMLVRLAEQKQSLLGENMFNDTCKHILARDEDILYNKKMRKNYIENELKNIEFLCSSKCVPIHA